ncbi:D-alanyl-glycyl endopeptidase-like protein [Leptomonas pyrrhocoris]|uniref:D-alanyl-glycyl endopeptidase-like protein n=1 Tax=Leptomonas pyrrhocoris TaxID=157538 RepID=A0A0N0DYP4_LEPPY|nr:D-alanyl-glycyl endopeptidase-like protein [Leptomonas pyrrhocoris]KPA84388.1 D-alanyl-glycyl endopeptidase-like protein [Leptomonas pyrrhocoris]|eukprot:XP_015662827.1 D-alanyl-glycyl endopeptidase-like protein [Leptomonas pyrrhocoris]
MRNRRSSAPDVCRKNDASDVRSSSPVVGGAARIPPRRHKELDVEDAALCDAYAINLRRESEDMELRRPSFWRIRCSSSIFVGLFIWALIGLVVLFKVSGSAQVEAASTALIPAEAVLPDGCRGDYCFEEGGTEPFGAVLGAHDGVYAYSNCYAHSCVSFVDFEYPIPLPPGAHTPLDDPQATTRLMRTGMKWQCVEYARRYWMLRGTPAPAVFGAVEGAADMWTDLSFVTLLDNVTTAPLWKYTNGAPVGSGGSAPRVGDLLIYPRDTDGKFPFGHVAVIVGVELPGERPQATTNSDEAHAAREGRAYIAEQNWHSSPWPEPYHNYSRWLPLEVTATPQGTSVQYTLHDKYHAILGWMRYGEP